MRAAERLAGATIREGCRVAGLLPANGGEMPGVVLESGEKILGESVVLTMGPWAADAQPWLGTALPVTPLKGQILRYAPSDAAAKTHRAYRYEGHFYIGPQENGEVWVGTTEETVGFATHTTAAAVEHISELAEQISPSLVKADVVKQTAVRVTRTMSRVLETSLTAEALRAVSAAGHCGWHAHRRPAAGLQQRLYCGRPWRGWHPAVAGDRPRHRRAHHLWRMHKLRPGML